MKIIKTSANILSKEALQALGNLAEFHTEFQSSITSGGGSFSQYKGEHQHWTDEQWAKFDHLVEVEVEIKREEGEMADGPSYSHCWGVCYFVTVEVAASSIFVE